MGGIAGSALGTNYSCSIENCVSEVTVQINTESDADVMTGGMAGFTQGINIESCNNVGSVQVQAKGKCYTGGIAGKAEKTHIECCINKTEVESSTAADCYAGGITGWINGSITDKTIVNSSSTADITAVSTGFKAIAGGITGVMVNDNIRNCYSSGNISATSHNNSTEYVVAGGIAGTINNNSGDYAIKNCYSIASVSATDNGGCAGGVAGVCTSSIYITNSYFAGSITNAQYKGGIAARVEEETYVTYSYWLDSCGASIGYTYSDGESSTGNKTANEMEALAPVLNSWVSDANSLASGDIRYEFWHTARNSKNNGYPLFGLETAAPSFSPAGGTYQTAQTVTISSDTVGAMIYYTVNGDEPTVSSTQYTSPISVSVTATIKAIAVKTGILDSIAATSAYTINSSSDNSDNSDNTDNNSVKTITVVETPEGFCSTKQITISAVGEPFGQSVEVRLKDAPEVEAVIRESIAADVPVTSPETMMIYPLDISMYIKGTHTKVQPKEGTAVKIPLPYSGKIPCREE